MIADLSVTPQKNKSKGHSRQTELSNNPVFTV